MSKRYKTVFKGMAMEKRIALECGNLDKAEVTSLNLDHCKSLQICGLTKDFVALETLSLINNGLTSLEGFPPLLKLRKLELADNFLSGGFEVLEACPNLQKINLSGNKIKDIESLRPLSKLSNLMSLDLYSNEITSSEAFPHNVKQILPNVQSFCEDELEGLSSGDEEEDDQDDEYEDEEDGSGDEIIRPLEGNGLGSSGGKSGPSVN
ncbi:putative acidic leucine-rich nuclear phosphoprotein 32 family member C, partial [Convolutriloba macropyga]|uniref:putative acidic leucine-rich nuclear phosphoprotein 32 family member C n=1 Tax=Convolutriloba macropyga TaxID=536237 RepID=UPI003F51F868